MRLLILGIIGTLFTSSALAQDLSSIEKDLRSRDPRVLSAAVERLGQRGDEEAVRALMGVVEAPAEDWKIQIRAINILAEIRNPMAVDLLIRVLNDPFLTNECPALRWNAARALSRFGKDRRIVNSLLYRLNDRDRYVREAVIQSLGEIGDPSLIPTIAPFLRDRSFALRMSAVRAVAKLGGPSAVLLLSDVAGKDEDPAIRQAAASLLAALKSSPVPAKRRSSAQRSGY